ncbi:MAG TPA: hypothetical protein VNN19_05270 [bacterium]|nr:hypothetical protein [bacterium]
MTMATGAIAATMVLYALIVDAAIETILSGSPLRWLVAGLILLYVGFSAVLWSRLAWPTRAASALGLLLALAALSALVPGGRAHGLVLLALPTPVLLAVVTMVATVVATARLLRFGKEVLPRWVVMTAGAYATMAWLLVAASRPAHPLLIFVRSLGTALGAFVLIPVGFVLWILDLFQGRVGLAGRTGWLQGASLAAAMAVALSGFNAPGPPPQATEQSEACPSGGAAAEPASPLAGSSDVPPQYRTARERLRDQLSRAALDPAVLQEQLGRDADVLFEFVRDRIVFQPYRGTLRGARGTISAQAGNAVDRSLLLASLLKSAGHRVRFAQGTMTPRSAAAVLQRVLAAEPRTHAGPFIDAIVERADSHAVLLGDTIHAAGVAMPAFGEDAWQRAVADMRDHVWVQVNRGGRWIDLDPTPGVEFGKALAPVRGVREELDPALNYVVELAVEVQIVRGGTTARQVVAAHRVPLDAASGSAIGLFHELEQEGAVARPFLVVGGQLLRGATFPVAVEAPGGSGFDPFERARRSTPSAPTSPPARPAAAAERTTAQWLHICIHGPGGRRLTTHTVFDETARAARGGPGIGSSPVSLTTQEIFGVLTVTIVTGSVHPLAPLAMLAEVRHPLSKTGTVQLLAVTNLTYAATRHAVMLGLMDPPPFVYVDFPNVLIARSAAPEHQGASPVRLRIDLASKAYRILRRRSDPSGGRAVFSDYLYNGVLDHIVERAVLGGEETDRSLGALIEGALDQDIELRVMRGAPHAAALGPLSHEGRAWASAALAEGKLLVLPSMRPHGWPEGSMAWWEVDPGTGWTVDTTELGGHSAEQPVTTGTQTPAKVKRSQAWANAVYCLSLGAGVIAAGYLTHIPELPSNIPGLEGIGGVDIGDAAGALHDILEEYYNLKCGRTVPGRAPGTKLPPFPKPPKKLPKVGPGDPFPRRPWIPPGGRVGGRGRGK